MPRSRRLSPLAAAALALSTTGCVTHSVATEFHGVNGMRGVPVEYQTTTSYALHGLFIFPLLGNAKKDNVIAAFTKEASANGATRTRIAQTSSTSYWFVLFPLSIFFTPVVTTVEGDVEAETGF